MRGINFLSINQLGKESNSLKIGSQAGRVCCPLNAHQQHKSNKSCLLTSESGIGVALGARHLRYENKIITDQCLIQWAWSQKL